MQIERKKLLDTLKVVLCGVEQGSSILEGADTFVFTEDGVFSYNDSIAVSVPINTGLTGAVKSKEFFNLLQKLKGDEFKLIKKNDEFIISSGNTRARIKLVESTVLEYLENLKIDELKWIKIDDDLFNGFKHCKLMNSNSPIRGLYVHGKTMYSTDEIRIATYKLKTNYGQFWIDDYAITQLLKIDENLKSISITDGWVHFRSESGLIFSCKSNDCSMYPEQGIDSIIESTNKKKKDPHGKLPASFKEVVDRVSTLGEDIQNFIVINLTLSNEYILLSSSKKIGSVKESIAWGEKLNITDEIQTSGDAGFLLEAFDKSNEFYITESNDVKYIIFTKENFKLILSTIQ